MHPRVFFIAMLQDLDTERESAFFRIFQEYFDLERDVGRQHDSANYSLDRLYPLAALAGNPERGMRLVHIAGTKGKGTTAYLTGALISASGHKCGVFSSPHLDTVRERFQVDGELATYDELEGIAIPLCEKLREADLHPSLFEIFTVLALQLFRQKKVEYAVLETGIGGRLDATNYPEKKALTIITPLSYDHTALLGSDIRQIALEKSGILRAGTPLVLARQPYPAAEKTVLECAAKLGAEVFRSDGASAPDWLPRNSAPYLHENLQSAWKAVELLGVTPRRETFRMPRLRARFETLREEPPVILDAAHNGDSARRLAEAVAECYPGRHFVCILGSVPGKDVAGIVEGLKGMDAEFILTNPETPRGSALPELEAAARKAGLNIRKVMPVIKSRGDLPQDMPLIFTGSFFTALIGEELF